MYTQAFSKGGTMSNRLKLEWFKEQDGGLELALTTRDGETSFVPFNAFGEGLRLPIQYSVTFRQVDEDAGSPFGTLLFRDARDGRFYSYSFDASIDELNALADAIAAVDWKRPRGYATVDVAHEPDGWPDDLFNQVAREARQAGALEFGGRVSQGTMTVRFSFADKNTLRRLRRRLKKALPDQRIRCFQTARHRDDILLS